jgi:hypothetical protein
MKRSAMRNFVQPANRMQGMFSMITGIFSILIALPITIQSAVSVIDTTMPTTIPEEIIADWEAQDGIVADEYAAAIDSIIKGLPTKLKSKVTAGTVLFRRTETDYFCPTLQSGRAGPRIS